MSYVSVPPAYYYAQQPGTLYRAGSRGWETAPLPGWGENPHSSWPSRQGVNGLGAAAPACTPATCPPPPGPPRFTFRGPIPQQQYLRVSIAPWGNHPHGPASQSPRESTCPECDGWPVSRAIGNVIAASRAMQRGDFTLAARQAVTGLGCGPCQVGPACATCPNDSDLPECAGCIDGQPAAEKRSLLDHPLAGPVMVGVVTAVTTGLVMAFLARRKVPVA